ncbi:MAG: type II secretion system F family protein [Euzebyales bacterium]|jgi:tight adherence protein B|nr:type II secretion system F family protein [Euzebyales bacterium]
MPRESLLLLATAAVLVLALLGARLLVRGTEERLALRKRSALEIAEHGDRNPLNRLDALLRRTVFGQLVASRLTAAGLRWRAIDFLAGNAAAAAGAYLIVRQLLSGILAGPIAILAVLACWVYVERKRRRRLEVFVGQLPDLARLMANSASAGLGVVRSLDLAAQELEDPAGAEIERVAQELRLGQSLEGALKGLHRRVPSREVGVLVSSLLIQQRSGGDAVRALREMAQTLEARKELNREVGTILAEAVFTGWAVAGMGVLIMVGMNQLYPGVFDEMLRSPVGAAVVGVGSGLFALGLVLIQRVSKVEV